MKLSILDLIIDNEGGYDNIYTADGTNTRCGITWEHNQGFYNTHGIFKPEDIGSLSNENIDKFYEGELGRSEAGKMPFKIGYHFLDHCINAGRGIAVELMQQAINLIDPAAGLEIDGVFGPNTTREFNAVNSPNNLLLVYKAMRIGYYTGQYHIKLKKDPIHAKNCLESWTRRVSRL